MTHAALSVLAAVVGRLSPAGRSRLGTALGFIGGSVLRIRRSLVEAAMTRAGVEDPSATARRMYRSLGLGLSELLWLAAAPRAPRDAAVDRVAIDPEAQIALEHAAQRGPVVLFASHTANWELAAAAASRLLGQHGKRLVVIAKAMHARGVDTFLCALREGLGIRVVPPAGALKGARAALADGDVVVMPIDQVPERAEHGLLVRFLGGEALADRAPATVALRARATVLVVAAERTALNDGVRVRLLEVIPPPRDIATARAWIDGATVSATAALERFVLHTPESWLWLHRRWHAPRGRAGSSSPLSERQALVATEEPS